MDQDILFELQGYVAKVILSVAIKESKTNDLIRSFPWLYKEE